MKKLIIPAGYRTVIDSKTTESAIKLIKDSFQHELAINLDLFRVTAPMIVPSGTGINDDLNGREQPVSFNIKDMFGQKAEIIHSLAKWKRLKIAEMNTSEGHDVGIYTDMNALRPDEQLSNIHSIYVDQWDWEKVIKPEDRNIEYLKNTVKRIYQVLKHVEQIVYRHYSEITPFLSDDITFIHSEELLEHYPDKTPKEREDLIVQKYGSVFIIGIGHKLKDGLPHDGRAPDYDDWITPTINGYYGLNGDILVWNPVLKSAFEISSMGIRVDKTSLLRQLTLTGKEERKNLFYHKKLLEDQLPQTIGGGIGQSRLCMLLLKKAHIGEVQSSIWPYEMIQECKENDIYLK
jgi:aspartate--ammonia ligase